MVNGYYAAFTGHERRARQLLLDKKLVDPLDLAVMSNSEVADTINANFECYRVDDDWMLIPKDKSKEFNQFVEWINR